MNSSIANLIAQRVHEARRLYSLCVGASPVSDDIRRAVRGVIYVLLYGMYENVVSRCVSAAIDFANSRGLPRGSLKYGFRLFALRGVFDSYRRIGQDKSWGRGMDLLEAIHSSDSALLDSVFPFDGSFMRPQQLELIWRLFALPGDPWPDRRLIGRIHELVEARNHIAHGTESAGERGGLLSDSETGQRIDDIEELCTHIAGAFAGGLASASDFLLSPAP